jgi:arylsulfatase A-like enzyme
MRLPLIWRPALSTNPEPSVVHAPVSLVSLASTFLSVAGAVAPSWVEGDVLPVSDEDASSRRFDATVTEWDSAFFGIGVHVRSIVTTDYLYTEYLPGTMHDGTEGELYDLRDDPLQRVNRCSDPDLTHIRAELSERLRTHAERPGDRAKPGVLVAPV